MSLHTASTNGAASPANHVRSAGAKPKAAKAPARVSASRRRIENLIWQIVLVGTFLLLWEYASDRWIPKLFVSKPTEIWATMWKWLTDGTYAVNLWVTIKATVAGFTVGASAGMLLGFVTGWWRRLGEILQPIVTAFYTLPRLALAPLFLFWFGLGSV
jgi:NitT/TauT family transport system permease protein